MAEGWSGILPSVWADKTEAGLTALFKNCVQDLAQEAAKTIPNGGRLPVLTGNLSRSVVIDNKPPTIKEGDASGNITSGIAAIKMGETTYLGWQAVYSRRQNYGFVGADSLGRVYNQAGYGFAEATAAMWPDIVIRQAAKMGNR